MVLGSNILGVENSLAITRGESATFQLYVTNPDEAVSGEASPPVNLTGSRVVFTVKRCISDKDVVFRKDSANGVLEIALVDAKAGEVEIYITPDDTSRLEAGEYVFDVWVILVDGSRYKVVGPASLVIAEGVTFLM